MTVGEVALELGVSRAAVKSWLKRDAGLRAEARQVPWPGGGRWMFRPETVERLRAERLARGPSPLARLAAVEAALAELQARLPPGPPPGP